MLHLDFSSLLCQGVYLPGGRYSISRMARSKGCSSLGLLNLALVRLRWPSSLTAWSWVEGISWAAYVNPISRKIVGKDGNRVFMRKNQWTVKKFNTEEARILWFDKSLTCEEVCARIGVSQRVLRRKFGLRMLHGIDWEDARCLWFDRRLNSFEAAKQIGCGMTTIRRRLGRRIFPVIPMKRRRGFTMECMKGPDPNFEIRTQQIISNHRGRLEKDSSD